MALPRFNVLPWGSRDYFPFKLGSMPTFLPLCVSFSASSTCARPPASTKAALWRDAFFDYLFFFCLDCTPGGTPQAVSIRASCAAFSSSGHPYSSLMFFPVLTFFRPPAQLHFCTLGSSDSREAVNIVINTPPLRLFCGSLPASLGEIYLG